MNNDTLVFLLVVGIIIIVLLVGRIIAQSREMQAKAMSLFDQWKERECESIKSREAELAKREAANQLVSWKADTEGDIRRDAVTRSQAVTVGLVTEHIAPFLPDFNYNPRDARFIGNPIDFVVFDGLNEDEVREIVIVEVKTGNSVLNKRERQIRDAIQNKRVRWRELRLATGTRQNPTPVATNTLHNPPSNPLVVKVGSETIEIDDFGKRISDFLARNATNVSLVREFSDATDKSAWLAQHGY